MGEEKQIETQKYKPRSQPISKSRKNGIKTRWYICPQTCYHAPLKRNQFKFELYQIQQHFIAVITTISTASK